MCNPTSQPPRRDLYELETSMRTADNGPFLLPKRKPRIGSTDWIHERPNAFAVFHGGFDVDGTHLDIGSYVEPWTVITPDAEWRHFWTHAEALNWAVQEARK
jgi:hypothetical protein